MGSPIQPTEALSSAVSRTSPGHPEELCQLPEAKYHKSAVEGRAVPRYKRVCTPEVCFFPKQEQAHEILKFLENYG